MTRFSDEFQASAWPKLLAELHGESVTFYPDASATASSTITGIWDENQTVPGYFDDGKEHIKQGVMRFNPDDITGYSLNSKAIVDGDIFAVVGIGRTKPTVDLQMEASEEKYAGHGRERQRGT